MPDMIDGSVEQADEGQNAAQDDAQGVVTRTVSIRPATVGKKHARARLVEQRSLSSKQIVLLNAAYMAFYHLLQSGAYGDTSVIITSETYIVPDRAREIQALLANWLVDELADKLDNQDGRLWGKSEFREELRRVLVHDLRQPQCGKFRYDRTSVFPSSFRLTASPLKKHRPGKRGRAEQAERAKLARRLKKATAA